MYAGDCIQFLFSQEQQMGSCFSFVDDDMRPPGSVRTQQHQHQQKVVYVPPPSSASSVKQQQEVVYRVPEGYGYAVATGKYSAPTEDPTPVASAPPMNWVPQAQYTYAYPMTQTMQYPTPSAPGPYGGASAPPYTTVYLQQPQQQPPQRQGMGIGTAMLGGFVLGAIAEDMLDNDF